MPDFEIPPAAQLVIDSYDPASGCYRREDGSLDPCPTEAENLGVWRHFARCIKPKVIVETGVYQGLSTCFLASALESNGNQDARIYSIDPWNEVITFDTPRTASVETVKSGPVSMGCTIARKIRHGCAITQDRAWLNVPEALPAGLDPFLRSRSWE